MENFFAMDLTPGQVNEISNLSLALIGDAAYELMCRTYLCSHGDHAVLHLHRDTVSMVNAPAQAKYADKLKPYLTEQELAYFRRGKNAHTHAAPKAATRLEYAKATGLNVCSAHCTCWGRPIGLTNYFKSLLRTNHGC